MNSTAWSQSAEKRISGAVAAGQTKATFNTPHGPTATERKKKKAPSCGKPQGKPSNADREIIISIIEE